MTRKITKCIFLGLLLVLCMSVAVAADVSENTNSAMITTSSTDTPIADTPTDEILSTNNDNSIEKQIEKTQVRSVPWDDYTFANETLDITDNTYDGQTLTLLDNVNVMSSNNQQLNNISFAVQGSNILIQNLNITNINQNNIVITVSNASSHINILNNNITTISNDTSNPAEVKVIKIMDSSSVVISGNTMNVSGVPQENNWIRITQIPSHSVDTPFVDAIEAWNSESITVSNNNITVTNSTIPTIINSTAKAVVFNNNTRNSTIYNNKINMNGFDYIHAVSLCYEINNVYVRYNDITMNGTNYVGGVFGDYVSYSTIEGNNITGNCHNTSSNIASNESMAYGINVFTEDFIGDIESIGVTIAYNNIYLNSTIAYGVEDFYVSSFYINYNNITIDANKAVGIAITMQEICGISSNNIQIHTHNDTTLRNIYELIPPLTSGIFCIATTDQNYAIKNNIINVTESVSSEDIYAIRLNSTNFNDVSGNYLGATFVGGNLQGNDAINQNDDETVLGVNYPLSSLNNIQMNSLSFKNKKILKNTGENNLKSSNQVITLNATNFDTYVTNHEFNENIHEGDVIDIDGILDGDRFSLNVNKAVNITSLKGNSYLEIGSFIVTQSGSNSNISNLNFVNTFIAVHNAQNVIVNNITSYNGAIQRRGQFSLGKQSTNVTVANSYFKSYDNWGTSCVVLAGCTNCLIENNTIEGEGRVGNIFSLNIGADDAWPTNIHTPLGDICYHVNITIRNNVINAIGCESDICYGLYIEGMNILVENNTVIHRKQAVDNYYGSSYNVTFINNYIPYGNFTNRAKSQQFLINNTLNEVYSYNDSTIINNTINKLYTSNNNTVENNNIGSIIVNSNNTILNNKIEVATIDGDNVLFDGNIVDSIDYNYSVKIKSGNNITITNNELSNNLTYGDEAIEGTADIIENNNGKKYIIITNATGTYSLTPEADAYYIFKSENLTGITAKGSINLPNFTIIDLNKTNTPNLISVKIERSICDIVNSYLPNAYINAYTRSVVTLINTTSARAYATSGITGGVLNSINSTILNNNNTYLNYINRTEDGYLLYVNYNPLGSGEYLVEGPTTGPVYVADFDVCDLIIDKSLNLTSALESYVRYRLGSSSFFNEYLEGNGTIHNTITFVDGSEGSNITNIIFNEKVYVNTSNILFNNCTFNKGIIFNNASENILEKCNITTSVANSVISIKLSDDANETITNASVTVTLPDGKTLTDMTDENGMLNVPIDLSPGENTIVVSYPGNETYNEINITLPITVDLNNTPINPVTINNIEGNVVITVSHDTITITEDAPITFINSTNNQIINNNILGYNGITISLDSDSTGSTVKDNTLNATTKYNIDSVTGSENNVFEDNGILYDVNINIEFETPFYAGELNPITINVTNKLNNEAVENGFVEILVDGLPYETLSLNNGQASTYFTYNEAKSKTLKVWYHPTEKYQTKKNTKDFKTIESTGTIQIDDITGTKVGEEITVKTIINSTDVIDEGNISFQFADRNISVPVTENSANYTTIITPAMMDDPTLRVVFETEKAKYNIKSNITTLTIEPGVTNIVVGEVNSKINDEVVLTATVTDNNNEIINDGEIIFTNDNGDVLAVAPVTDGVASVPYTFTEEYNGKLIATTNSTYREANTAENNLNVRKINTIININTTSTNVTTGETLILSGSITDEDGNILAYKDIGLNINVLTYNIISNDKGTFSLPYSPTIGGTLTITANYNGDKTYNATTSNIIEITVTDLIAEQLKDLKEQLNDIEEQLANLNQKLNTSIIIENITGSVGSTTIITANVFDQNNAAVNEGRVVFKVNGITLRDSNDNVLYAQVVDGIATLKYTVPKNWIKNTNSIEAVFSETGKYASSRTTATDIFNISEGNAHVTINDMQTYETGDKMQFIIKVVDENNNPLNGGKVIIKANGVTLKDLNGKALQANVVNGIAVIDYNITLSVKTYNITAVYSNNGYKRAEAYNNLTIVKSDIFIKCDPITTNTNTTTIQAQILNKNKQPITNNVKVNIKINGKTVDTVTAINGIINTTIPTKYNKGTYTLVFLTGNTNYYNSDRLTTVLIKE